MDKGLADEEFVEELIKTLTWDDTKEPLTEVRQCDQLVYWLIWSLLDKRGPHFHQKLAYYLLENCECVLCVSPNVYHDRRNVQCMCVVCRYIYTVLMYHFTIHALLQTGLMLEEAVLSLCCCVFSCISSASAALPV